MPSAYCSSSFSWPEPSERSPSSRSRRRKKQILNVRRLVPSREKSTISMFPYPGINIQLERSEEQKQLHVPDRMWLREANIRSINEAGTVIVFLVSSSISSFRVITLKGEKSVKRCKWKHKLKKRKEGKVQSLCQTKWKSITQSWFVATNRRLFVH